VLDDLAMTHTASSFVHDTNSWHVDIRAMAVAMPSPDRWASAVLEHSAQPMTAPAEHPAARREVRELQYVVQSLGPV
jgi:hypothetical protein